MKKKSLFLVVCVLLIVSLSLVACTPSKDSLVKKYTDAGYVAEGITAEEVAKNTVVSAVLKVVGVDVKEITDSKEGIDYIVVANKQLINNAIVIAFKSGADAKEFYNTLIGDKKESENVVKKGNAIIFGTKDAVAVA